MERNDHYLMLLQECFALLPYWQQMSKQNIDEMQAHCTSTDIVLYLWNHVDSGTGVVLIRVHLLMTSTRREGVTQMQTWGAVMPKTAISVSMP